MATGAAPAPEVKVDTKTETTQTAPAPPTTLAQRFQQLLHEIFAGHADHAGWHQ
jgi:hypothetical protein